MNNEREKLTWKHAPVMENEILQVFLPLFKELEFPVYYDLTLGLGGHSKKMLDNVKNLRVVGIDRDQSAIDIARKRLQEYVNSGRFHTFLGTYDRIDEATVKNDVKPDAILMDLGVSSMQIDNSTRGFAYNSDQELDMRMTQSATTATFDAKTLISNSSVEQLREIITKYSGERYSLSIAQKIHEAMPQTTFQLSDAIRSGLPSDKRRSNSNYAMQAIKRVFQSIRIAVNNEMQHLEQALPKAINELKINGLIAVLTYHSLEENIVKSEFKKGTANYINSNVPKNMPLNASTIAHFNNNSIPYLESVKAPKSPSDIEITRNSRAKSARLRVMRKVAETTYQKGGVYAK